MLDLVKLEKELVHIWCKLDAANRAVIRHADYESPPAAVQKRTDRRNRRASCVHREGFLEFQMAAL